MVNFWLIIKVVSNLISAVIFIRIWKYLEKKPLGMQTLLDLFIKDHIRLMTIHMIVTSLAFVEIKQVYPQIGESSSHITAVTLLYVFNFTIMAFFVQILTSTIIKYLAIFHQGYLDEIEERKIVRVTRFIVGVTAFTSVALSGVGYKSTLYAHISGIELEEWVIPNHFALKSILILDAAVLAYVQVKIELFKKSNLPKQIELMEEGNNVREDHEGTKIDFALARKIVICLILGLLFLLQFFFNSIHEEESLEEKFTKGVRMITISFSIPSLIIPLIFIKNTKNLYNFCVKPFKT